MILSFKNKINGKPTLFKEKIQLGLSYPYIDRFEMTAKNRQLFIMYSKKHTIREDKNNRWHAGRSIQFYNGNPRNGGKEFATGECISEQKIEIVFHRSSNQLLSVIVDNKSLLFKDINKLAINDGFNNIEEFAAYFKTNFTAKIIHWTNLRY